jgi:hypothetical protein
MGWKGKKTPVGGTADAANVWAGADAPLSSRRTSDKGANVTSVPTIRSGENDSPKWAAICVTYICLAIYLYMTQNDVISQL